MLTHLVLFELREDATDDAIDAAVDGLRGLVGTVPEIVRLTVGRDAGLADGNAGLALVLECADEAAWRAYQQHPAHVRVVQEAVRPIVARRTAAQLRTS